MNNFFPFGMLKAILNPASIKWWLDGIIDSLDFKTIGFYVSMLIGYFLGPILEKTIFFNVWFLIGGTILLLALYLSWFRKGSISYIFDETFHLSISKFLKTGIIFYLKKKYLLSFALSFTNMLYVMLVSTVFYMIYWYHLETGSWNLLRL